MSKDIRVVYRGPGNEIEYNLRAAICVEDGSYAPESSALTEAGGGTITDAVCENVKIASAEEGFTGIFVRNSDYTINDAEICFTGNGVNDFAGYGAAIRAGEGSKVTVNRAKIETRGCIRPSIWVGENAEAIINDSEITAVDGVLPDDYGWRFFGKPEPGSVIMECPWMLGIRGNNRATVLTGGGFVTYNNCNIRAEGWGALGVDGVLMGGVLTANNCLLECTRSGYGAFADGDVLDVFSGCTFNVADQGLILGGGSAVFKDNTIVNSGGVGILGHDQSPNFTRQGLGVVTIEKGCEFNTEGAVIQLKNVSPSILADGARLNSGQGIILEAMINDDPFNVEAAKHRGYDKITGEKMPDMMANPKYTSSDGNDDIDATFKNMELDGDIINSMMEYSSMNIRFENTRIIGAITTATAEHAIGRNGEKLRFKDTPELSYLIGKQKATYAPVDSKNGVAVSLSKESVWTVSRSSYITALSISDDSRVAAPDGGALVMEVDGAATAIKPGAYSGKISLLVL